MVDVWYKCGTLTTDGQKMTAAVKNINWRLEMVKGAVKLRSFSEKMIPDGRE